MMLSLPQVCGRARGAFKAVVTNCVPTPDQHNPGNRSQGRPLFADASACT